MRLLEIGGGNCPSIMKYDSNVEYFGVDRSGVNLPEQNLFQCSIEEFSQVYPDDLRFDYVFAANVLGNLSDARKQFKVVNAAGSFVCEGGRLVILEYLTPKQARLSSFKELVKGRVVYDASPDFKTEWQKHKPVEIAELKSRLNLKSPFQMLVNTP